MLVAEHDGRRVRARDMGREDLCVCPGCRESLVIKKGGTVVHHFAHRTDAVCSYATAGETADHMAAKAHLCEALQERGLRADVEVPIGDRRADVLAYSPTGQRVAFEFQHVPITTDELAARMRDYMAEGAAQVWFPFLRAAPGSRPHEAAPLAFEEALYRLRKSLWTWDADFGALQHVTKLDLIDRYVEEFQEHGGYFKTLKAKRRWSLGTTAGFEDVRFEVRKSWNRRLGWYDWAEPVMGDTH